MVPLARPWRLRKASSALASTSTMALPMPTTSKEGAAMKRVPGVGGAKGGRRIRKAGLAASPRGQRRARSRFLFAYGDLEAKFKREERQDSSRERRSRFRRFGARPAALRPVIGAWRTAP